MSESIKQALDEDGFVLIRNALETQAFDPIKARLLRLAEDYSGERFASIDSQEFVDLIRRDRDAERVLYDQVRRHSELEELGGHPDITTSVRSALGNDVVLLEKIPLRIDCPLVMREIAVWHQDFFYVKGSEATVTVWAPLLDTSFKEGCLLVMPGSHKFGALEHDQNILEKKYYPSGIFNNPVRYVEMKAGDILLFHSLLLHSSGNNIGDSIRFSVQWRYTQISEPSHESMGKRIEIQ